MIPRYTRPDMQKIWEPDHKFKIMLEVETLAAEAMALAVVRAVMAAKGIAGLPGAAEIS